MAAQVEIEEAKSRLDELFARVKSGEEITFAEKGRPVAMLRPAEDAAAARGYGMFKGQVWMADDLAALLTDAELKDWGL